MDGYNSEWMLLALQMAHEAFDDGEVPVGAVITRNGELVATGRNRREKAKNALMHAEIDAINNACKKLGGWRLWNCELYVTLEPCPMCAGAVINAHIPKVYFGAYDNKNGSCGTVTDLFSVPFTYRPQCFGGLMEEESATLLKGFFIKLRNK